ncbi:ATP-binding response regulator [Roseicyclus mahoneyensis]|uniref:histidine kinase n=1 Tax=Roseicyclus mahoneyensis TaxID=164332 RepID=A0A316GMT3_9RHOB|nr:ATP-binding protein [Roseicyclus mahoneyensis]PWK62457.1 two-component system cell cycle sensor histidine kinase/response regulator CckA [Roseicyclus mahoneyensis]
MMGVLVTDEAETTRRLIGEGMRARMQPVVIIGCGVLAAMGAILGGPLAPPWTVALWAISGGLFSAGLLLSLRRIRQVRRLRGNLRAALGLMQHDPSPCFCTDPGGAIVCQNDAAIRRFGDRSGQSMARAISGMLPNASAVVFRHETALDRRKSAQETVITPRGTVRLTAHDLGAGVFWRIDDQGTAAHHAGDGIGLPMMVVSQSDTVLSMNAAMRDVLGRRATALDDVFDEVPIVAGRRIRLKATTGPIEVIPVVVAARDGRREVYAVPGLSEPPAASVAARAFEALPVALLHIGSDGRLLASNRHAQQLLDMSPDASGTLSAFVEGLGRPVNDWVMDTLAERIPDRSEVVRARRRDQELFVQITLSRITDATGPSLLAVLHDATELKTLEQQFVQSQKMQAIGELAGGVAHDFNNLLTAITGHCDLLMLRHDQGDPDYADLVQINQNANRAAALVGQLLAFSRKQTLEPEILDLRDTMGELTHLLNRLVGEKISLTLSHDPALLPIRADRRQLDQVIMNLVVNARDAMPDGGEIRVETRVVRLTEPMYRDRAEVPAGRYVTIRVRDQGHGIPPDKLTRIFEPFFTTKRVGEGTGLGLSMAYGIVKQTGGYIFVDSVVGVGSTFTIYCPAYDLPAVDPVALPEVASPAPPCADADTVAGATMSLRATDGPAVVMLVEDEAPVRAFASRALRLRGYTVIEADCAEDALSQLEDAELAVDLFVTDVVMPGMDGPSWVRQALERRPGVKVVFVSGYAEEQLENGSIGIPNSVFLAKPFSLTDLTETVQRQLH